MMTTPFTIFALSDATGELAEHFTAAVTKQFPHHNIEVVRVPNLIAPEVISHYVGQAKQRSAVIIFTFVIPELRQTLLSLAQEQRVVAIDVLGPALDVLANYFHEAPSTEPGLMYRQTHDYFKRVEAIEYTFSHDDGLGSDSLAAADIILLGVSRTFKTPLAIYLAYQGYRCANIPLAKNLPVANAVQDLSREKMIGLTIDPERLATIRETRMRRLGRYEGEPYALAGHVKEEIDHALTVFSQLKIPVVDVTGKAIEEIASEVLSKITAGQPVFGN